MPLKGDVDGEGRGVSRYDEQGKYKETLTEHEYTGQFWKGNLNWAWYIGFLIDVVTQFL